MFSENPAVARELALSIRTGWICHWSDGLAGLCGDDEDQIEARLVSVDEWIEARCASLHLRETESTLFHVQLLVCLTHYLFVGGIQEAPHGRR